MFYITEEYNAINILNNKLSNITILQIKYAQLQNMDMGGIV